MDINDASSYTKARKRADRIDVARPAKRRKVSGLNTRFNRMIESVNTMLSHRNSSPASSRKSIQSSGTSSVSSHDIPKTPVHGYDSIYSGKLGKDSSVLKTKFLPDSDGFPISVAPPKATRDPLPDWLTQTFCSLEAHHPLRGLLSPSRVNAVESTGKSNSASIELPGAPREEDVFAFSPFDKEEEAPGYRADGTLDVHVHASSFASTELTLPHLQMEMPTLDPLPFSTPGRFATARRSTHNSLVHTSFQKRLAPEPQQMTTHTNMRSAAPPLSHLRRGDVIGPPRIRKSSSNLAQCNGAPSDLQEHGVNTNHHHPGFRRGRENMDVYVTPGPTFACSPSVYFDSPTEDPSLSDPLEPDSYQLDLGAIDFRWRPFLRSNAPENDANKHLVSPSSPWSLRYAVPDPFMLGDPSGWNAHPTVDKTEHGASSEDLPYLSEDLSTAYLDDVGPIRPRNVNTTQSSAISNAVEPCQWSLPINDVQQVRFASQGVLLSPLRDQPEPVLLAASHVPPRGDGENIHASKEFGLMPDKDMKALVGLAVHGMRPSTPLRQTPVSLPSTPQKLRSSQLRDMPRAPVRKTYSALSWMIPLKPSKRTVVAQVDIDRHVACISANSRDSIESWSETS